MRRLAAAMAILVACATSSGETWMPPWVSEPSAEERARDEYEERQRIEQRLKDLEREAGPLPPAQQDARPAAPSVEPVFTANDVPTGEGSTEDTTASSPTTPSPVVTDVLRDPPAKVSKPVDTNEYLTRPIKPERSCCKYCDRGKPCGDTCIAQNKTCHVGRGCAC